MQISIFGTGYVGLVTGTCLAEVGHDVLCVDVDAEKVRCLHQGIIPIYEPGLEPMDKANHAAGRLDFTTDAARTIAEHMQVPTIVVDKSTVPVGTADLVRETIAAVLAERGVDMAFDVVSNPEFLKEGAAVEECMRPDRIVLGVDNPAAVERLKRWGRRGRCPSLLRHRSPAKCQLGRTTTETSVSRYLRASRCSREELVFIESITRSSTM